MEHLALANISLERNIIMCKRVEGPILFIILLLPTNSNSVTENEYLNLIAKFTFKRIH